MIHISEMSWTRRVRHPSEILNVGDEVHVMVLHVDPDEQKISLGLKQTQPNPWKLMAEKYPVGSVVKGHVRAIMDYGAFVEIEDGIDGLLHVGYISWTRR
jgi:small subunit ribosomal protein S1